MKGRGILRTLAWLKILVFVLILVAPTARVQASQGRADFSVEPPTINVTRDEMFTVNIKVDAIGQPVDGAQAYLNFDRNYLRVVDASGNETNQIINGQLYNATWSDVLTNTADNSTSQINYAAGKGLYGNAANTLFTLATVRFKAIAQTGDTPTSLIFNTNVPRATKAVYGLNTVTGTITNGTVTISGAAAGSAAAGSAAAPTLTTATTSSVELAGVTNVTSSVTETGRFTEGVAAKSENNKVELTIPKDTIGKNKTGTQLDTINIQEMTKPPAPPTGSGAVGLVYDIGPDGATFDPPIKLSLTYSESEIPQGVAEGNLVVATWDGTASQWSELASTVDKDANTVTAKIGHFTAFTVLAHNRPASFTVSNLLITPPEINVDEPTTISAIITNSGDLSGTYGITIKVDNTALETKNVTLIGGGEETVSFSIALAAAGEYIIDVNGVKGILRVNEAKKAEAPETPKAAAAFITSALTISPAEVNIGENVGITVTVTNSGEATGTYEVTLRINDITVETKEVSLAGSASQRVTFTTAGDAPGKYEVMVSGLSGIFSVKTAPALPAAPAVSPVNWPVLGSIIAGVALVIGLIIWMLLRQRARGA